MHGITAARTLAALQRLYELKLASYPRTDSRYITHDDLETLHELTQGTGLVDGFIDPAARPAEPRYALVVDDSKVAGHTAILPTRALNSRELDRLDDDQRKVITRIVRRMWEAIGQDRVHDVTKITAVHDGHTFTSRSDQTIEPGWTRIEPATDMRGTGDAGDGDDDADLQGNVIPVNLTEGIDLHPIHPAQVVQGETKPPARFTDATLLAAMEHASRYVQDRELKHALDDDESHSGGIGTPATRADIIEKTHQIRIPRTPRQTPRIHADRTAARPDRQFRTQGHRPDRAHGTGALRRRTRISRPRQGHGNVPRTRAPHPRAGRP